MIGAANRDPRRWPDADQLRVDRPDPKPISFGGGIHSRLGAALTRPEMSVALPAFLHAAAEPAAAGGAQASLPSEPNRQ